MTKLGVERNEVIWAGSLNMSVTEAGIETSEKFGNRGTLTEALLQTTYFLF